MKTRQVSVLNIALLLTALALPSAFLGAGRVAHQHQWIRIQKIKEQIRYLKSNYSADSPLSVEHLQELKKIHRHYPPVILRCGGELFVWAPDESRIVGEDEKIQPFFAWAEGTNMSQVQIIYPNADPDLLWDGI